MEANNDGGSVVEPLKELLVLNAVKQLEVVVILLMQRTRGRRISRTLLGSKGLNAVPGRGVSS